MKLTCVTATFNVIAAGNRERLIRCVESVAKLPVEHEHLIYDGASTDGTVELLRELEKTTPGLKVVSESDTGIYNALNKGVVAARGTWLYILGCDDRISDPMAFGKLVKQSSEGNGDISAFPVWLVGAEGRELWRPRITGLFRCPPYSHQGVIMRTELVRRMGGFDEHYKIAADWDLFLRCHLSGLDVRIFDAPCAEVSLDGVSSCGRYDKCEDKEILSRIFSLSADEQERAVRRQVLPFCKPLHYCWHSSRIVRLSAWGMLLRALADGVGAIDDEGHLKIKRERGNM